MTLKVDFQPTSQIMRSEGLNKATRWTSTHDQRQSPHLNRVPSIDNRGFSVLVIMDGRNIEMLIILELASININWGLRLPCTTGFPAGGEFAPVRRSEWAFTVVPVQVWHIHTNVINLPEGHNRNSLPAHMTLTLTSTSTSTDLRY